MVLNQTSYNKAFNLRINECLQSVAHSYGNILDIPRKADIIFNYEFIKKDWLAAASVDPNAKVTQSIISFNPLYVEEYFDEFIEDIIPHELSHIICFLNRLDDGHGKNWKTLCREMGGTGEEFHRIRYA
jgi:hypothetical protein